MSEAVSEGNLGLMQAVKRFEPERGFRLATYAMWWIKASIQEYILRSWSLVKIGTTGNQKKLFFKLRRAKSRISALDEGDLRPDQAKQIATKLGVSEQDVIDMNRRLGGDASLNAPASEQGESEWQDWLIDDQDNQERKLVETEEASNRHDALIGALGVLNPRERRIFEARRLADDPLTLEDLSAEFGVSRERVRQIEARAFERIRHAVKAAYATREVARTVDSDQTDLRGVHPAADRYAPVRAAMAKGLLVPADPRPAARVNDEVGPDQRGYWCDAGPEKVESITTATLRPTEVCVGGQSRPDTAIRRKTRQAPCNMGLDDCIRQPVFGPISDQ
jgi:RNA polymerase sigma-32 factor